MITFFLEHLFFCLNFFCYEQLKMSNIANGPKLTSALQRLVIPIDTSK